MPRVDPEERRAYDLERYKKIKNDPVLLERQRKAVRKSSYKRYHANKEYRDNKNRNRVLGNYGLSMEEFNKILEIQENKCAICRSIEHVEEKGKRLHIDHNHETGKVRGLLCVKCNTRLMRKGMTPAILRRAANYLERQNE